MNKLFVIAQEVYRKNVFSFSFIFMVLSPILFVIIFGIVGYFIGREAAGATDLAVAVVDVDRSAQSMLEAEVEKPELIFVDSIPSAQEKLVNGDVEGYLTIEQIGSELKATFYHLTTNKRVNLDPVTTVLSNIKLDQVSQELQLTPQEIEAVQNIAVQIDEQEVQNQNGTIITAESDEVAKQQEFERNVKLGSAYGIAMLVFMFMMAYSALITEEIASEKGTRIMEVILSSVSATTSFFGKLLGIMLVIFTQIFIYALLGLIFVAVVQSNPVIQEFMAGVAIPKELGLNLLLGLAFFIFGVIIYASLATAFGSLVSRSEDVQKAAQPMVFIGLIGFYIGMYALTNPNSPVVVWASYIPLWTPFVMPFRVAADTVTSTQLLAGIFSLVIGSVVLLAVSIMFYKSNVLIYSDKGMWATFKTSLKLIRNNKKQ